MNILIIAKQYIEAGYSVIPIKADGSKTPACYTWTEFQNRQATETELEAWFCGRELGIGIPCGKVSKNLCVLDFELWEIYQAWMNKVESNDRLARSS